MSWIKEIVRPEILDLVAYSMPRDKFTDRNLCLLDANESPYSPFSDNTDGYNRYPEPQPLKLRALFAKLYNFPEEQILISRGADEVIDLLISAFCIPFQDAIVSTPPTFNNYSTFAKIRGAEIISIPLDTDFKLNIDAINLAQTNVEKKIKILFLCTPNSSTGTVIPLKQIEAICENYARKALVVIDEAYIEFAQAQSALTLLKKYSNVVVLRTMSKAFAMAGLRLGVTIASKEIIDILKKVIHECPIPIPCSKIARQALSSTGLERTRARITETIEQRNRLFVRLSEMPIFNKVYNTRANFLLVVANDSQKVFDYLITKGILVKKLTIANALRITVGTKEENETLVKELSAMK